ncbi:LOW QUALITY PROTEIN: hypothetical protein T265_13933 [Opisthorchis viverrini]|uniref:Reverse transcriptase/retrotransposon-derived protein RNase H-like domain-containing protein n=1 Tax=Opisthorchis viverrini TaxID=6198 RepID=A0A075AEK8_OPIVI|nr:LOW QUALITY PROTEIN: hypothetical protein T265_13933 [Opisthorchis viverrini]KER26819.1 LOW QUALITY PROTEIN: hypothetical protein T265_13933 [Opisthorchis viverrini]
MPTHTHTRTGTYINANRTQSRHRLTRAQGAGRQPLHKSTDNHGTRVAAKLRRKHVTAVRTFTKELSHTISSFLTCSHFALLRDHGVVINAQKYIFGVPTLNFLGHTVNQDGISPTDDKLDAIRNFPLPTSFKQLKRFLGMINFYRRFIPKAASLLAPRTNLISGKPKTSHLTDSAISAFEQVKASLANSFKLFYLQPNSVLSLNMDTSNDSVLFYSKLLTTPINPWHFSLISCRQPSPVSAHLVVNCSLFTHPSVTSDTYWKSSTPLLPQPNINSVSVHLPSFWNCFMHPLASSAMRWQFFFMVYITFQTRRTLISETLYPNFLWRIWTKTCVHGQDIVHNVNVQRYFAILPHTLVPFPLRTTDSTMRTRYCWSSPANIFLSLEGE